MHLNKNVLEVCIHKNNFILFIRGNFQNQHDSVSQIDVSQGIKKHHI